MARIAALDDVGPRLRSQLLAHLRVVDEAVALPQAHVSVESKIVRNVVLRLSGTEPGLKADMFSPGWFNGVSLMKVPSERAEMLLSDKRSRQEALAKLREAVPSEMANSQLQVGPELACDAQDRDSGVWTAGFDGPSCCVGLYSALQNKSPESLDAGMSRAHCSHYIVCKAGGGIAAQTFHARLASALKQGCTLDEALGEEGSPGAKALRRVAQAARRNRGRIMVAAAEALGFYGIDTIGDNASPAGKQYRIAVPTIDCVYNSLRRSECGLGSSVWQYAAGCIDAAASTGLVISSNAAEGFVAFTTSTGEARIHLKNDAYSCLPFTTVRAMTNRDAVLKATEAHKLAKKSKRDAHPDYAWLSQRFAWKAKIFTEDQVEIEPPCLWGTHSSECFLSEWARELGVSRASPIRLQPELVAISAVEQGKLRVATKAVASA